MKKRLSLPVRTWVANWLTLPVSIAVGVGIMYLAVTYSWLAITFSLFGAFAVATLVAIWICDLNC